MAYSIWGGNLPSTGFTNPNTGQAITQQNPYANEPWSQDYTNWNMQNQGGSPTYSYNAPYQSPYQSTLQTMPESQWANYQTIIHPSSTNGNGGGTISPTLPGYGQSMWPAGQQPQSPYGSASGWQGNNAQWNIPSGQETLGSAGGQNIATMGPYSPKNVLPGMTGLGIGVGGGDIFKAISQSWGGMAQGDQTKPAAGNPMAPAETIKPSAGVAVPPTTTVETNPNSPIPQPVKEWAAKAIAFTNDVNLMKSSIAKYAQSSDSDPLAVRALHEAAWAKGYLVSPEINGTRYYMPAIQTQEEYNAVTNPDIKAFLWQFNSVIGAMNDYHEFVDQNIAGDLQYAKTRLNLAGVPSPDLASAFDHDITVTPGMIMGESRDNNGNWHSILVTDLLYQGYSLENASAIEKRAIMALWENTPDNMKRINQYGYPESPPHMGNLGALNRPATITLHVPGYLQMVSYNSATTWAKNLVMMFGSGSAWGNRPGLPTREMNIMGTPYYAGQVDIELEKFGRGNVQFIPKYNARGEIIGVATTTRQYGYQDQGGGQISIPAVGTNTTGGIGGTGGTDGTTTTPNTTTTTTKSSGGQRKGRFRSAGY